MPLCLAGLCAVLLQTWPPTVLWPRPADPGGARCSPSAHTTSSPVSQSAGENTTWETMKIKAVNHKKIQHDKTANCYRLLLNENRKSSVCVYKNRYHSCNNHLKQYNMHFGQHCAALYWPPKWTCCSLQYIDQALDYFLTSNSTWLCSISVKFFFVAISKQIVWSCLQNMVKRGAISGISQRGNEDMHMWDTSTYNMAW